MGLSCRKLNQPMVRTMPLAQVDGLPRRSGEGRLRDSFSASERHSQTAHSLRFSLRLSATRLNRLQSGSPATGLSRRRRHGELPRHRASRPRDTVWIHRIVLPDSAAGDGLLSAGRDDRRSLESQDQKLRELVHASRVLLANGHLLDDFPTNEFNTVFLREDRVFNHVVVLGDRKLVMDTGSRHRRRLDMQRDGIEPAGRRISGKETALFEFMKLIPGPQSAAIGPPDDSTASRGSQSLTRIVARHSEW